MEIICKKKQGCTGCEACNNVCPKHCIDMVPDEEGFLVPRIDQNECIDCGLCERTCPVNYPPKVEKEFKRYTLVGRIKDSDYLEYCSSGGVFTALAIYTIKNGGVVYGAVYDNNMRVCHARIGALDDIKKLSGSKYVQSEMGLVFKQIKDDIEAGKRVLFCGTPCQCAGLEKHLGKKREKVAIVDLVCHGVPSQYLWQEYLRYIEKEKGRVIRANFRSKHWGYHMASMETEIDSGKKLYGSARTNPMLKCYFKNVADRHCCYDCDFKTVERATDLTLFDSWHASELNKNIKEDDKGYTCIIVQSKKGMDLIENAKERLSIEPVEIEDAIYWDGKMIQHSILKPGTRDDFYLYLRNYGIGGTVDKMFRTKPTDYIVEKFKPLIRKIKSVVK